MSVIEPVRKDEAYPQQIKKHSAPIRSWHWVNMIVISGSLITVLINSTLLDRKTATPLITAELKSSGVALNAKQAGGVARALGDKVWEIHTYFGYVLATLLLFRLISEFFQLADQRFIRKIKSAYSNFINIKKQRELARHELAVKSIYAVFYILLIVMVVTGLFLAFEDLMAPYKAIRQSVKSVHGFCMYLIIAFIVVHVTGVWLAEHKPDGKGIVSDMINGGGEPS